MSNVFETPEELIDFTAKWWADRILIKKAATLASYEGNEGIVAKSIVRHANQVTDEAINKFINYFKENAYNNWIDCRHLDMDWSPRCKLLRDCMNAAGFDEFHMPCKCASILDVSDGVFAARPDYDEPNTEWAIYAKLKKYTNPNGLKDISEDKK